MDEALPVPGFQRKPDWLKVKFPSGETWKRVDEVLSRRGLHTVCDEAHCPNKGECWGMGTATFMILGDICTRGCRFCAVATAKAGRPLDEREGIEIALAAEELKLDYVLLTSVDRDDLPDRGSGHFASCVRALRQRIPHIKVEVLIPDYRGAELTPLLDALPDVIAHNVETVPSLQRSVRDHRASFEKSAGTLEEAAAGFKVRAAGGKTKSSILLGLGEKPEEVLAAMDALASVGTDILVLGQYLRPSKNQLPVLEYVGPEQFARYKEEALRRGFSQVVSSPLARTSYHAKEAERGARAS
jgi:lipoic acid synthetase